jgi:hypothetical protein
VRYSALCLGKDGQKTTWSGMNSWKSGFSKTANEYIVEFTVPWSILTAEGFNKNALALNIQGPATVDSSPGEILRLRTLIDDRSEVADIWKAISPTQCKLFTPVSFDTVAGDLGKIRTFKVRLHFAEPDDLAVGQRVFDIALQGATKLTNFDIAAAAGGARKPIVKEFVGIQIKDILTVNFTPKVGVPVISGMEILEDSGIPDTQAPSTPSGLQAKTFSSAQVNLSWTDSTDNFGVVGYYIFRDGKLVGNTRGTTFMDGGLDSLTSYSYKVAAYDLAGNVSSQSTAASASTTTSVDTTAPVVTIESPLAGAILKGAVTVRAEASDLSGIVGVQFKVDGVNLGVEDVISQPFSATWDTTAFSNGEHVLSATARDTVGNSKTVSVTVSLNNEKTPPTVSVTSPSSGASVSGIINIAASCTDASGVTSLWVRVGGSVIGGTNLPPGWVKSSMTVDVPWDSKLVANGSHTITAVANDKYGNEGVSSGVIVTVDNSSSPSADSDNDGLQDAWERTYFISISDVRATANADPDGDGLTNADEYKVGTSPINSSSRLSMESPTMTDTSIAIRWNAVLGKSYEVQSSVDGKLWVTSASIPPVTSTTMTWTDNSISTATKKFYRIRVP